MCGICGIIYKDGTRPDQGRLKASNDLQTHRGPDDEGYYIDGPVGLAMRQTDGVSEDRLHVGDE